MSSDKIENGSSFNNGKKRGRKELRVIRRTSAKNSDLTRMGKKSYESHEDSNKYFDRNEINEKEEEKDQEEGSNDDDDDERKENIYGALLTILKSEHPEPKRRKKSSNNLNNNLSQTEQDPKKYITQDDDEITNTDVVLESENEQIENALDEKQANEREDEDEEEETISDHDSLDSEDETDPFESHFNKASEQFIDKLDNAFKSREIKYKSLKLSGNSIDQYMLYSEPRILTDQNSRSAQIKTPIIKSSIHSYFLKQRLKVQNDLMDPKKDNLTQLQKDLVDPMFQYKDILYEYGNYGTDEEQYRNLYSIHILNHIYKTRDRILKNNQKLQDNPDAEFLDQGFTRPKVLIIAPTRDTAYHIVDIIINKSGIDQVDKKSKFKDQFLEESLPPSSKPKSFQHIFKGNTNDFFILGIKFTRKAIKLYSNFYQSDIIVCSPLGLQMIVENTDKKKRQDDFLSSIELTIIDQLYSIEFQNISHLFTIFDHLNRIPQEQHDTDFSRIRMWYINDQARLFRQTMIFTKYISPVANSFINGKCQNWSGRWKNHRVIQPEQSGIGQLGLRVRQIFQRFDVLDSNVVDEPEYRFKNFTSVVIPSIIKSTGYEEGILIYITDYSDYVRIRNYMKDKTNILFGDINEYSDQRQLTANRTLFQQNRIKVLLYTERLHHFRRYEIKGVKSVIFYKPPSNPEFYNEIIRYIGKSVFLDKADINISTVKCIYSKMDALALENIVGTKRAGILCHAQNETYEFK